MSSLTAFDGFDGHDAMPVQVNQSPSTRNYFASSRRISAT